VARGRLYPAIELDVIKIVFYFILSCAYCSKSVHRRRFRRRIEFSGSKLDEIKRS